jgi:hypothetical protein
VGGLAGGDRIAEERKEVPGVKGSRPRQHRAG